MKITDDSPIISVVMLNYNGLKYLERTIQPILELDYPNYEFIIVDNGSTDGSLEFINKFERIRLIQSPRLREKNFACNYAIKNAKGDYILLLDNDILIQEKTILNSLIVRCTICERVGSIGLSLIEEGYKKSKSYGQYMGLYFTKETKKIDIKLISHYDNINIGFPSGGALFIKKFLWQQVGGYDDHLKFGGDDNDLGIKLWIFGFRNYLYSKSIQIHLGLPERQDTKKYSLKSKDMFYAHLYTIVKNYSLTNMIITLCCYSCFAFIKSIKQSIQRSHAGPFQAFFQGYYLFLRDLPIAIRKRKEIQSKRIIKRDIFLKIKPPKYVRQTENNPILKLSLNCVENEQTINNPDKK